jgi:sugar phosphate isomerase/epimerase
MKFAICNETFQENGQQWPMERIIPYCAEIGYEGIEIAPFTLAPTVYDVTPARRAEIRTAAEKTGMRIIGLHWLLAKVPGLHVNHPDDAIRSKTEAYLGELVSLCADLGGEVMVFGSPAQRSVQDGWSYWKAWERTVEIFKRISDLAARRNVYLAVEPLTTKETNFIISLEDGLDMVQAVGHDHCLLHLDVKAMAADARRSVADTIHAGGGKVLRHFHANDPNLRGPGFGNEDFVPIFRALNEIGYDRWVSVEVFDYSPDPQTIATRSLEYLRKCQAEALRG